MKLRTRAVRGIGANYNRSSIELQVDLDMTEGQMLDAILAFLEAVPGERWEEWKRIIDGGSDAA